MITLIDLLQVLLLAAGLYVGCGLLRFGDLVREEYKRARSPEDRFDAAASGIGCILLWPWSLWLQRQDDCDEPTEPRACDAASRDSAEDRTTDA